MSRPTPADQPSQPFQWKIENFSKLKTRKLYSDAFYAGGYKWRVLIFPKGNTVEYFSVYLDAEDSATLPYGWTRYAQFSISVINQIRNEWTVTKDTQHQFRAQESDWGFTSFLPLEDLTDPVQGFLLNDTVIVEVDITVPRHHILELETLEIGNDEEEVSVKLEAEIAGTPPPPPPQTPLQSTLGSHITLDDGSSKATATAGKVRFLSYWISSETFQLLEKIHGLHEGTFVKFSMKGQALQTLLLESFSSFIASMSSSKVGELDEEALRLAAISIEDYEQVGLELSWLKQRLEEAKRVKKHSESVNTVESCATALEVARAKVRELEEGLAKAKAEAEAMFWELPKSPGVNDSVLRDIV